MLGEFFRKGIVALGWNETGKIPKDTDNATLKHLLADVYPDYAQGKVYQSAGQLWRFYK